MAYQPPAYKGAAYNADIYKSPSESLSDYLVRLSRMRSAGVLGGGGMLDTGPTPTVTTPDYYSDQTDLGVLKKNVVSDGGNEYVTPQDTRTAEEKLRDAVAYQSGAETNWGKVIMGLAPFGLFGTVATNLMDSSEKDLIEGYFKDQALTEEQIKDIMDNPKELANRYATGAMVADPMTINASNAGMSLGYIADNPLSFLGDITGINPYAESTAPYVYPLGDSWNVAASFANQPTIKGMFTDYIGTNEAENVDSFINPVTGLEQVDQGYGYGTTSSGDAGALNAAGGVIGTVRDSSGNAVTDSSGNAIGGRDYSTSWW